MKNKKVTIIGCGLIGGSVALALRQSQSGYSVACIDLPERLPAIRAAGVADEIGTPDDLAKHVPDSSTVLVATPVQTILDMLARLRPFLREGTIVTDVGSTKKHIMAEAQSMIPSGVHFIGGHPMAGSESSGVEAADPLLFSDRVYVLCPYPDTPPEALLSLMDLAEKLLALPVTIEAEEHDRIMATVSHLPQLISVALMHTAQVEDAGHAMLDKLAGRGFLDMTRLAASDYGMWKGILETNRNAIERALDRFEESLSLLRNAVFEGQAALTWEQAGKRRRKIGSDIPTRLRRPELRSMIDRCDKQIVAALGHRVQAVRKIGRLKMNQAAPVHDADREKRMMVQREEWGRPLGLPQELIDDLFAVILKHSATIQAAKGQEPARESDGGG
jgi:prephenate dehydrogenase